MYEELVRLREKVHTLTGRVNTLEVHSESMRKTLDRVETKVDAISTADQIAEAVARHDRSRNRLILKPGQKYTLLAGLGIVLANLLLRLFGVEGL